MADPFIGEIRLFAGNFAPRGWAFCNGALLDISQNTALFAVVGTIYGGDGRTTLGLPDLSGRAAMHVGTGPGLSARPIGSRGGAAEVTLATQQLATHRHTLNASTADTDEEGTADPAGATPGTTANADAFYGPPSGLGPMADAAVPPVGGGDPHNNLQPYLAMNYIIAVQGVFPSRS